jgi:F0F1-type ATP synthase membrane subunit b/b'
MFQKTHLVAAVLGGFLLVGSVVPSVAADNCEEHVRKAEEKLKKEIDRHGEQSSQAEHARRDVEKQRDKCNAEAQHGRNRDHQDDEYSHPPSGGY